MPTYLGLTLANICRLFKIVSNCPLKQTDFLSLLPKEIANTFFPDIPIDEIDKKDRVTINPLFTRNHYNKMSFTSYVHFKKCCVDKNRQTLNRSFFNDLKRVCHDFANTDAWENIEIEQRQLSEFKFIKKSLEAGKIEKSLSPLKLLTEMFKCEKTSNDKPNSFKNTFFSLYQYYNDNPTSENLETVLAYAVLCSIFPNPETLDGYHIPPALTLDIFDFKTTKSGTFKQHTAVRRIGETLKESSYCIVIGPHGSGKESLVNAFEVYSNHSFSSFQYYSLTYEGGYTSFENEISLENLDEALSSISMKTEHNPFPAVIVLSNWRGRTDTFFNKFSRLKNSKIIFLTTNQTISSTLPSNCCIDLTNNYAADRKICSKKVFLNIYGSGPSTIEEKIKLENLLEKIGYHFFSTIMLARSMGRNGLSILEKAKQIEKGGKMFEEADVLQHTRNLGLDDLPNNALQFLRLLCLLLEEGISKSFFSVLDLKQKKHTQEYKKCLEASLIQETPDRAFFKLCPHIQLALIGSANFHIEDETIFPFFMHIAKIAETCHDDMLGNDYREYFSELTKLISFLLKLFPYKPGQFTSAYISLVRFLWIADNPKVALFYLQQMEIQIKKASCRFLASDLAQVHLTMGYIYNNIGDKRMAATSLENADRTFIRQQTNAFFMQALNDYSDLKFSLCLDDLQRLKILFGSDSKEAFTGSMQIARLLVQKFSNADGPKDKNDIFRAAKQYLDKCCSYFEDNNIKPALATSLYLRAVLMRSYNAYDLQGIIDDLSRAKQLRASIRGADHSWMIPIYLEEAELYVELMRKDLVAEYTEKINKIISENHQIQLQKRQYERLYRLECYLDGGGI